MYKVKLSLLGYHHPILNKEYRMYEMDLGYQNMTFT